jgi:uncharacterized protein YsxB (DUF464 family)
MISVAILHEEEAGQSGGLPKSYPPVFRGFSIRGHSGSAESGKDIVCAAVSSMSQLVTLGLLEIERRYAGFGVSVEQSEGYLRCYFSRSEDEATDMSDSEECAHEMASFLVQMLEAGLNQIAAQYPSFVKVKREILGR